MKFTAKENIQLGEIRRRIKEFKKGNKNATMIFLGFPSEVKSLVDKKILISYSKERKRALNWYNLTETGKQYFPLLLICLALFLSSCGTTYKSYAGCNARQGMVGYEKR